MKRSAFHKILCRNYGDAFLLKKNIKMAGECYHRPFLYSFFSAFVVGNQLVPMDMVSGKVLPPSITI